MKTLHQIITEAEAKNDVEKLIEGIEGSCKKYFPDSYCKFEFRNNLGPHVVGRFTLRKEYTNKIIQNDPAFHVFMIHGFDNEGNVKGKLETESSTGSLSLKSTNPMYAFDRVKTGFRKKSGDVDAIIKHYDTFWKKLKGIVDENEDKIPELKNF